jgi:uncharacterized BrkB/YihY/UPF0761 family membrane protein
MLAPAIGLMTWMWMSATVLFGAELNSEIEQERWAPDGLR